MSTIVQGIPTRIPLSRIGNLDLSSDMDFDQELVSDRSMDSDIVATTRRDDVIADVKWDLKRYKNFLRKSYQLKVKPSIIRARSVRRKSSVSNRVKSALKYRSRETATEGDASFSSISSGSSFQDGWNSSDAAMEQEKERRPDGRIPERTPSQMEQNSSIDSTGDSRKSFAEIHNESWSLLYDDTWYSDTSGDEFLNRTEMEIMEEIYAAKNLNVTNDDRAPGYNDHLMPWSSTEHDAYKTKNVVFDKYRLVCPNQVVGRYGIPY